MSAIRQGIKKQTVTIASGASTSVAIRTAPGVLAGISVGASLAGLTSITLTGSDKEDGVFRAIKNNSGTATAFALSTDSYLGLSNDLGLPKPEFIKLVGNTTTSADLAIDVYIAY